MKPQTARLRPETHVFQRYYTRSYRPPVVGQSKALVDDAVAVLLQDGAGQALSVSHVFSRFYSRF